MNILFALCNGVPHRLGKALDPKDLLLLGVYTSVGVVGRGGNGCSTGEGTSVGVAGTGEGIMVGAELPGDELSCAEVQYSGEGDVCGGQSGGQGSDEGEVGERGSGEGGGGPNGEGGGGSGEGNGMRNVSF